MVRDDRWDITYRLVGEHKRMAAPSGHNSTSQFICTLLLRTLQYMCTSTHLLVQLLQLQGVQPRLLLLLLMAVQHH